MKVPDPNLPFGLRQRDIDAAYGDLPDKPERDPDVDAEWESTEFAPPATPELESQ